MNTQFSKAKIALLTSALVIGLVSCPDLPTTCTPSANVSSCGVTGSLLTNTNTQIVPKATVDAVTATQIDVNSEPADKPFAAGQFVVSDAGDGLVRQISSVTTQSSMVGSRLIKKVYIQTTDASLEDVISSGDAGIDYGSLDLSDATNINALPGINTRAVNGKIGFSNVVIPLGSGAGAGKMILSGSVTQTLNPSFNLNFSNGSLEKFQLGLSGSFGVSLSGSLSAPQALSPAVGTESTVYKSSFTRAFALGVVPVVIVIEPKLILGAAANADKQINMTAGISPTVKLNFNIQYDRNATPKWKIVSPSASFDANPVFSITTPSGGQAKAYARLALDMKFYGLAGPELETKPYSLVTLVPNQPTKINSGITLSGKVVAGFKILGKGLEVGTEPLLNTISADYSCTTVCTASELFAPIR
jgi:hypothetical protein